MSATILNLVIVVLASVFIGVLFGRRSGQKSLPQAIEREREKIRAEVQREHTDLAVELHGELSRVRDSIIQSAHAYQNVVKTIDERLAPWSDVMPALAGSKRSVDLPLLKVETAEDAALSDSTLTDSNLAGGSPSSTQAVADGEDAEPGLLLQKKAAELIKEDRAASQQRPASTLAQKEEEGAKGAEITAQAEESAPEAQSGEPAERDQKVSDIASAAQKRSSTESSAAPTAGESEEDVRKQANAAENPQIH